VASAATQMDNNNMTDIPLWVPAITAVAPIIAVTIPLVINAIRDDRRDERAVEERLSRDRQRDTRKLREECAELLGAGHDFKVLVENDLEYNGPQKAERGWEIRARASALSKRADVIGMLLPGLVAAADTLSAAAARLVPSIAGDEARLLGGSTARPDFAEYDRCLNAFKEAAMRELAREPPTSGSSRAKPRRRRRKPPQTAPADSPAQLPSP
jgi:hypothetical protein